MKQTKRLVAILVRIGGKEKRTVAASQLKSGGGK